MCLGILRCLRWIPGPMPPLCKGRWPGVSRVGGIDLLRFLRRTLAPLLRWARFLPDEKSGKESPKAGPSPALWNPPRGTGSPCVLLFAALVPVGSHRWHITSQGSTYSAGRFPFHRQGLKSGRCAADSRPPSAGWTRKGRNLENCALSQQEWRKTEHFSFLVWHWLSARPENHRRSSLVPQGGP